MKVEFLNTRNGNLAPWVCTRQPACQVRYCEKEKKACILFSGLNPARAAWYRHLGIDCVLLQVVMLQQSTANDTSFAVLVVANFWGGINCTRRRLVLLLCKQ